MIPPRFSQVREFTAVVFDVLLSHLIYLLLLADSPHHVLQQLPCSN